MSIDEIFLLLFSVLVSLIVALLAVIFDRWLADKKGLKSTVIGITYELLENLKTADVILEVVENNLKYIEKGTYSLAPLPIFADFAYSRIKNSDVFFRFVTKEKTGVARRIIGNLHDCYNVMRSMNHLMESMQQIKVDVMLQKRSIEYVKEVLEMVKNSIKDALRPKLEETLDLLRILQPNLPTDVPTPNY